MPLCKQTFSPFNVARARAVQDELINVGCRETDLDQLVADQLGVHGTVQSQAGTDEERIVLAPPIPPGVARLMIFGGGRAGGGVLLVAYQPMEFLHCITCIRVLVYLYML